MPRNSLIKIVLGAWIGFFVMLPASAKPSEDTLIVKALLNEEAGKLSTSRQIYKKLYLMTGKKEYLIQESKNVLMQKLNPSDTIERIVEWIKKHPQDRDVELYRMLVALYMETGALEDAENVADEYLSEGTAPEDQIAVASLKIELGKADEALELLQKAYRKKSDEGILQQIVLVTEKYLKDTKKAINVLEEYIDKNEDASIGSYFKLIELYAKEDNIDKVSELYKKLYTKDPQKYFLQKIIETYLYKNDIDGAISFLENTNGNEELLFSFYREKKRYRKAIEIARQLYSENKNPKWLAEEAMLIYESEKQKTKAVNPNILKQMADLMEKALGMGLDDPLYLNYYGYTLIDHDKNIDKGIELVKKALNEEPYNSYYLDSLAWGLYKKGRCAEAYSIMKQVVLKEGLEEEEIKMHWDLIKKCHFKER